MRAWPACVVFVAVAASAKAGPDWTEMPDAPNLPPGQNIPFSPVDSITGDLVGVDALGGPDIADMYRVTTTSPNTTVKTGTLPLRGGVANFDTVLFVFDQTGRGIVANDDIAPGHTSSAVTLHSPGTYLLAVAAKGVQPVSSGGPMFDIYNPLNRFAQVPPTPAGQLPIQNWVGMPIDPEPRHYRVVLEPNRPPIPVMSRTGLIVLAAAFAVAAAVVLRRGVLPG